MNIVKKNQKRTRQKQRVQFKLKKINVYNDKLRISLFLSEKHCSAQVISADGKSTVAHVSTQQPWFKEENKDVNTKTYNVAGSELVGKKLGQILHKDFSNSSFYLDRGRRRYSTGKGQDTKSEEEGLKKSTTRVKALADAIRQQGIVL